MAQQTDQLTAIIAKPSNQRGEEELAVFLPWLRRRVAILRYVNDRELLDVVKYCQYAACSTDDVIIKQGDQGDRMYVLLRGSASVYIDPAMTGEEDDTTLISGLQQQEEVKPGGLDRSVYGRFIVAYGVGESFGEAVLLSEDKTRNATVIATDDCQMMAVDQSLFDKALKTHEQQLQEEIVQFVDAQPVFARMSSRFKRILQLSLRKVTFVANTAICSQGNLVTSVYFITRGEVNIWSVPSTHQRQYPYLGLTNAGAYLLRRHAPNDSRSDGSATDKEPAKSTTHSRRTRREGASSKDKDRPIHLCSVQSGEVVGDVEIANKLDTYLSTVTCSMETTAFRLDVKNLERIVGRRNPYVMEVLKQKVQEKLELRAGTIVGKDVPLLSYLMSHSAEDRLLSARTLSPIHMSKELPSKDIQIRHLLSKFRKGQAEIIIPLVPGALIYKDQMQDRARIRANIRKRTTTRSMLVEAKRSMNRRQPRSRRAIMAALSHMTDKKKDVETRTVTPLERPRSTESDADEILADSGPQTQEVQRVTTVGDQKPSNGTQSRDNRGTQSRDNRVGKQVTFHLPQLLPVDKMAKMKSQGHNSEMSTNPCSGSQDKTQRSGSENHAQEVPQGEHARTVEIYQKKEVPATSSSPTRLPPLAKPERRKLPIDRYSLVPDIQSAESPPPGGWRPTDHNADDPAGHRVPAGKNRVTHHRTLDVSLDDLESRVKSFLVLHCPAKNEIEFHLPRLRRYSDFIENEAVTPVLRPGGKVFIKRISCPFSTSSVKVTNHQHVRHHMFDEVPDKRNHTPGEVDFRLGQ